MWRRIARGKACATVWNGSLLFTINCGLREVETFGRKIMSQV